MAERTGFEPATPGVTGRYSNQLNYRSALYYYFKPTHWWVMTGSNRRPSACKADALPTELITQHKRAIYFLNEAKFKGGFKKINGGTDGIRTRDPRRDRPVF